MQYRTLGRSGAVVSTHCLGTMTFGAEADETASGEILTAFTEAGGTFVDTADVYSAGVSEEILGRWLRAHPTEAAQLVVATKGRFPMGDGPNDLGLSRRHLRSALEDSLRRLGTDHVDLYQLHASDAAHAARRDAALPRRRRHARARSRTTASPTSPVGSSPRPCTSRRPTAGARR